MFSSNGIYSFKCNNINKIYIFLNIQKLDGANTNFLYCNLTSPFSESVIFIEVLK